MARKTQAQVDGYVECSECGHALEQHDTTGCIAVTGCTCPTRWTKQQIMDVRQREGLPRRWNPTRLVG